MLTPFPAKWGPWAPWEGGSTEAAQQSCVFHLYRNGKLGIRHETYISEILRISSSQALCWATALRGRILEHASWGSCHPIHTLPPTKPCYSGLQRASSLVLEKREEGPHLCPQPRLILPWSPTLLPSLRYSRAQLEQGVALSIPLSNFQAVFSLLNSSIQYVRQGPLHAQHCASSEGWKDE